MTGHNNYRTQYGAPALTWSDSLASTALTWVTGCVFKHSGGQYGGMSSDGLSLATKVLTFKLAENLAAGTGNYTITDAINDWMSEASSYDPNNPVASHFTQVVWKSTTQVGCATYTCPAGSIFDASYGVRTVSLTFVRRSNLLILCRLLNSLHASTTPPAIMTVNMRTSSTPVLPESVA